MSTPMTNDEILAYDDRPFEIVKVKAWGGAEVIVKCFSSGDCDTYYRSLLKAESDGSNETDANFSATLVAMSIVDKDGNRRFTPEQLKKKSGAAIQEIYPAAARVNKIGQAHIEEAEKNS